MSKRIGEYILDRRIGGGTFAEVWLAHHHVWAERQAAVKLPTHPQAVRQLQREGFTVHTLNHPNIVRPIGFDPYADPPYYIMEYVPGTSLRPLIQRRALSPEQAADVLRQVLTGLGFAHSQGIIHRDIKPENILIHEQAAEKGYAAQGMVKLTDFGLGQSSEALPGGSILHSVSMDTPEAAGLAGTLDYMAPEARLQPDRIDARADLYACGVVLYEMLTGERPAGLEMPSELNPAVPPNLDAVFRRAYARLENRFGGADEFLAALNAPNQSAGQPRAASGTTPARAPHRLARCPACGQAVGHNDQFCLHCGTQLVEQLFRCPACGAYPDPGDNHCIFCGANLDPLSPTVHV